MKTTERYDVRGYALAPTEFAATVEASSEAEAIAKAQELFKERKMNLYVSNTEDPSSAYDWQPTATKLP